MSHLVLPALLVSLVAFSITLLVADPKRENSNKVLLYLCFLCGIFSILELVQQAQEIFTSYYSGAQYEWFAFKLRITGPYWYVYWLRNIVVALPILFFFQKFRKSLWSILTFAILGLLGYYFYEIAILSSNI